MNIRYVDLLSQYDAYKAEIDKNIQTVLDHGLFIQGPEVSELEKELSRYVGCKHAIGVSSGTDALVISLLALDVQPDDEIIVPVFTFIATAEVISLIRAKPVFIDIKLDTFNIDCSKIEEAITENTKGIITSPLMCVMIYVGGIDDGFIYDVQKVTNEKIQRFGYFKWKIPIYRDYHAKTNYITFN